MKHRTKSLTALAVLTAAALCVPAVAAFADSTTTNPTTITGTITPSQITATVPTTASFGIDPWKSGGDSQIVSQSNNLSISNASPFPIYARITNVDIATGVTESGAANATLVQGDPSDPGQVQLAIKNASDTAPSFSMSSDWLKSGSQSYPLSSSEQIGVGGSAIQPILTMKIYGRMNRQGWAVGDTFTVTPTFTIQAVPFTS